MDSVPVPRDITLPMPAEPLFLEGLLVFAFIAHILFVNLMVGGSLLVLGFELRGLKNPDFARLARTFADTITVNKSLAVVLGVAPLLLINVLYTVHFYTANALTGTAWILVIPSVAATFLLLYLHKYTRDALALQPRLHAFILALAVGLLLVIPLIFLSNVNLMMLPERWTSVHGFLSALALPNVFPRYLHFLSASLIVTSLFGTWYTGRPTFSERAGLTTLGAADLRRVFYSIAFAVSLAQYVIGPLVLFTLPSKGTRLPVVFTFLLGAAISLPAVWMLWKELTDAEARGKRLGFIVGYLSITVVCMASGRHMYRYAALASHRAEIHLATEHWIDDSKQAAYELSIGAGPGSHGAERGKEFFDATCAACHGVDKRVVGPPLTEIAQIYGGHPEGIVAWARAPGKKRPDYTQMPAFAALGDDKLRQIAEFMLKTGGAAHASAGR